MRHPYFAVPRPTILAHRGADAEAPENTLLAFERALAQGADILESDVHATRDGVPVLLHDATVERTTEGEGPVAAFDWDEVRRLDAGYRFSPDGGRSFPFRGQGLRIPSLEEAFEAFPRARFNLEIKSPSRELIRAVVRLVAAHRREELTLLTAGDDAAMAVLREELGRERVRPALGASTGDVVRFVRAALDASPPPAEPMALQIPAEFAGQPLVTPRLVDFAHAHDVVVHVWTVNERDEMERLLDVGVDGLVTDFPARLAELRLARRAAH